MVIIENVRPSAGFDMQVDFYTNDIDEVSSWCSHTFTGNFVILEFASKVIAGGTTDNLVAWEEGWNKDNQFTLGSGYALRSNAAEAELFLLKFKESE